MVNIKDDELLFTQDLNNDYLVKCRCGLFLIFFKAFIDNQILHSVLKGFINVFTEMYFGSVSGIPQLSLETVGLLLIFVSSIFSAPFHKIERIDWLLYALTLCDYSAVTVVMVS